MIIKNEGLVLIHWNFASHTKEVLKLIINRNIKQHSQAQSDQCKISTDGVPISSNHPSNLNLVSLIPEESDCTLWMLLWVSIQFCVDQIVPGYVVYYLNWKIIGWPPRLLIIVKAAVISLTEMSSWERYLKLDRATQLSNILLIIHDCQVNLFLLLIELLLYLPGWKLHNPPAPDPILHIE